MSVLACCAGWILTTPGPAPSQKPSRRPGGGWPLVGWPWPTQAPRFHGWSPSGSLGLSVSSSWTLQRTLGPSISPHTSWPQQTSPCKTRNTLECCTHRGHVCVRMHHANMSGIDRHLIASNVNKTACHQTTQQLHSSDRETPELILSTIKKCFFLWCTNQLQLRFCCRMTNSQMESTNWSRLKYRKSLIKFGLNCLHWLHWCTSW